MKSKFIWIAVAVLAGLTIYFMLQEKSSTLKGELTNFAVEDTASITQIFMADKADNRVKLNKVSAKKWKVNDKYPASVEAIEMLLETVKKLKVRNPVPLAAQETVLKNLSSNHIKVEIYTGENSPAKVYYVGSANQKHNGSYMLLEGSKAPFLVHIEGHFGFLTPRYHARENDWRSRVIFNHKIDEIAEVEVRYTFQPSMSFVLERETERSFAVRNPENNKLSAVHDTLKAFQYLKNFEKVNFENFEETKPRNFIDSVLSSSPMFTVSLTDVNGNKHVAECFRKPPTAAGLDANGDPVDYDVDRLYVLLNNKDFVVAQYFVFDRLTRKRAYFTAENVDK